MKMTRIIQKISGEEENHGITEQLKKWIIRENGKVNEERKKREKKVSSENVTK